MKKQKKFQPKENRKSTEIQKAQALIEAEKKKKMDRCNKEITAVLDKYGLILKTVSHVVLVPKNK